MKRLVWVLLAVNVALFGYFRLPGAQPGESRIGHEAISPEKLKILTPEELAALPKKAPEPVPPAQAPAAPVPAPQPHACYDWGYFSTVDLPRARHILDKFSLDVSVRQQTSKDATRYWIYIPPRKSMEEAQAKVGELSALGVEESFIVEEPRWRYAISLAMYKDEALATRYLEELRKRGVRSAVKGVRNHESGQSSFHIKNMSEATAGEIGKLKPDFPGSELKQVACQ